MHKHDTGFLPSIPNQKVESCCLDAGSPRPRPRCGGLRTNMHQKVWIDTGPQLPTSTHEGTVTHILADVLGSVLSPTALLALPLHARNSWNASGAHVTKM